MTTNNPTEDQGSLDRANEHPRPQDGLDSSGRSTPSAAAGDLREKVLGAVQESVGAQMKSRTGTPLVWWPERITDAVMTAGVSALVARVAELEGENDSLCDRLETAGAEVDRLNNWADGFSDRQLEERRTCEMYERELRAKIADLERERDEIIASHEARGKEMFKSQMLAGERLDQLAALQATNTLDIGRCIAIANIGFEVWRSKDWNARWAKRIDGTPIPNDVPVCIAKVFFEILNKPPEEV